MSDPIILVSADSHAGPRPEGYLPYMEQLALDHYDDFVTDDERYLKAMSVFTSANGAFGPDKLPLVDTDEAIRSGGLEGSWDPQRRLKEMDREGVAAEVLFMGPQNAIHPYFTPSNRPTPLDLRAAGLRAFHRWLADFVADSDGRLIPIADIAGVDMDATAQELRWCADHGFKGVMVPGMCTEPALPPLYDHYYDPFWQVCCDTGLRTTIHAGWGLASHGQFLQMFESIIEMAGGDDRRKFTAPVRSDKSEDSPLLLDQRPARAIWQLMAGGVFDRFPDLRIVLTEVRADWVPATLQLFDERFARGGTALKHKPSEYFARHVYVAPSSPRRSEIELRHQIGVDRFLFGRDYPHPEGTWPNTHEWIRATFDGVPENEARLILGENAIECFGLDRTKLKEIAKRIGPKPEDVLGHYEVSPDLIEHFDLRSGYAQPATPVDTASLGQAIDEDLALLRT